MIITESTTVKEVQDITKETMQQLANVDTEVDCNGCHYSQFAGFGKCMSQHNEHCLKFDKELQEIEGVGTKPCNECKGTYFEEDRTFEDIAKAIEPTDLSFISQ